MEWLINRGAEDVEVARSFRPLPREGGVGGTERCNEIRRAAGRVTSVSPKKEPGLGAHVIWPSRLSVQGPAKVTATWNPTAASIVVAASLALTACAGQQNTNQQTYAESVASRPMPVTDQDRMSECNWIRSEIARQQSLSQASAAVATSPLMAVAFQATTRNNISALESRASNVRCTAAFSNAPAAPAGQSFDQCFARCQQYTDRTKNQCFDSCNH
jgi:hypothetical protein